MGRSVSSSEIIHREADKTMMLPHLRGKYLIIWIPAFAGMTTIEEFPEVL
jgi:hypothetical protein